MSYDMVEGYEELMEFMDGESSYSDGHRDENGKYYNIFDRECFIKELEDGFNLHVWRDVPKNGFLEGCVVFEAYLTDCLPEHDVFVAITKKAFMPDENLSQEEQVAQLGERINAELPAAIERFKRVVKVL